MADTNRPPGKTTVAPSVLVQIAKSAAMQVEGVSKLAHRPGGVDNIFKRGQSEGIRLQIKEDQRVYADVYVILTHKINVRDVSKNIQVAVNRAISEMVDMQVKEINIHVEDINYETEPALS